MPQLQSRSTPLGPMIGAVLAGAALTGIVVWRVNIQSLDRELKAKRSTVKKLVISGDIPPNQEVMDYLAARQKALDEGYRRWLEAIAAPPLAEAAQADPQLYFQQHVHDVQRALERLATAQDIPVPTQLGLPKELPPSETVPRLLAQLQLIQQAAELIFEQGVTALASLKVEDPETMSAEEGSATFLIQLPVRIRFTGSLDQVMKVLGAVERMRPFVDVRSLRLVSATDPSQLDAEMVVARYLVMAATPNAAAETLPVSTKKKPSTSKRRSSTSKTSNE